MISTTNFRRADRAAAGRAPRRLEAARLLAGDRRDPAPDVPRPAGRLPAGTLAVVNDTRVVPARIRIEAPRGEVLLLERLAGEEWEGLARPTRRLRAGRRYGPVELLEHLGEGRWRLRLHGEPDGEAPLPPYITEPLATRSATRRSMRRPPDLRQRRRQGCTSRRSSLRSSRSSA